MCDKNFGTAHPVREKQHIYPIAHNVEQNGAYYACFILFI